MEDDKKKLSSRKSKKQEGNRQDQMLPCGSGSDWAGGARSADGWMVEVWLFDPGFLARARLCSRQRNKIPELGSLILHILARMAMLEGQRKGEGKREREKPERLKRNNQAKTQRHEKKKARL